MQHSITQSLAACAAILLAITSIGAIVTVPPAHASVSSSMIALA